MQFAQPGFLYGLILIPLAIAFLIWAARRREAAMRRLGDKTLVDRLSLSVNWRGRRWKAALWLLGTVFVLIALARPQWGQEVQSFEQQGIEIMVTLDVSNSMLAEDLKPNRLARAKLEISDLMRRLNGDEVGLVLFSGASFIQFPLTSDYATANAFLSTADPSVISRQGTALGEAIRTAMTGFDQHRATQKVIVIYTDGEDHESDALTAAQEAANAGAIIYTIGIGSPDGVPIPEHNAAGDVTGYKQDSSGNIVVTKLNEETLRQIADATGGQYFRASADSSTLDALAGELDKLQKSQLESRFEAAAIERFQGFLLLALVALVLIELIPDRLPQKSRRLLPALPRRHAQQGEA